METDKTTRLSPSSGGAMAAFVFGAILTLLTFAAFGVVGDGREEPLRTAELSIPLPELPAPPGIIPQGETPGR